MAFSSKLVRDGDALKIDGGSDPIRLFFVEHFGFHNFLNTDILRWIDRLADNGVNGMRVFGFWPFGKGLEAEPFVKTSEGYDLNRFNDAYFTHLQHWVSYAQEKGIVVLFELFDAWGITNTRFAPYHPFYQIVRKDLRMFSQLQNQTLMSLQKSYIQKVVEALQPNLNVIFGIMNEFKGQKRWHYEMSKYLKRIAPEYLTAGSKHDSPALDDPNIDLWFVHTGRYDFDTGNSYVWADIRDLRRRTGEQRALGFSTAGFGGRGKYRENPTDMRRLAQDVVNAKVTLFGFVDHKAYTAVGGGKIDQVNTETYRAIADVFHPTVLCHRTPVKQTDPIAVAPFAIQTGDSATPPPNEALPAGYLDLLYVAQFPSPHPQAVARPAGKVISATTSQGFLCIGQSRKEYPVAPLSAMFSISIDNNTLDDHCVLNLDVYDQRSDRTLSKTLLTRKDFPEANVFCLFRVDFTPPDPPAEIAVRMYYLGHADIVADYIAIINPDHITLQDVAALFAAKRREQSQHPLEARITETQRRHLSKFAPEIRGRGGLGREMTNPGFPAYANVAALRPLRAKLPAQERRQW